MPCSSCNEQNITILGYSQILSQNGNCACSDCDPNKVANSSCVLYGGPNLNCLGVETCDDLNTILSKIDEKLCTVIGDYSLYNKFCLDDLATITTEQQFVEAISEQFCTLKTDVNTFLTVDYVAYQTSVDSRFDAIEVPGITCTAASVVPTDSLNTILTKYCSQISNIQSGLDLSGVNWSQCFIVSPAPTTVAQGFDILIDQICAVKAVADAGGAALPTFNNVGSCLPAPVTTTDSLVDTVNKIKTKLCTLPAYDNTSVTWGCVTSAVSFQDSFQNVINKLTSLSQSAIVAVSSDFTLTPVNAGDLCQGWQLNFAGSIIDSKVALNVGDVSPGYLLDKMVAGSGVTFDLVSQPGKVVIDSTGSGDDNKVKSYGSDPANGFLIDKLEGAVDIAAGLTIGVSVNTVTNKVKITPVLDMATFITSQLAFIQDNAGLRAAFCDLVSSCTTNPPVPVPTGGVFYAINNLSGTQITSITSTGSLFTPTVGSLPLSVGQSVTGVVLGTTDPITVIITGVPIVSGNLKLYKNGILQQCINITVANTYVFNTVAFTNNDNITIALETGLCT